MGSVESEDKMNEPSEGAGASAGASAGGIERFMQVRQSHGAEAGKPVSRSLGIRCRGTGSPGSSLA